MIHTLEELDDALAPVDTSPYDEQKRIFASFRMEVDRSQRLDPRSAAYRDRELGFYEWISGKRYSPANDVTTLDVCAASRDPFPYFTENAEAVGNHLMAIGYLIRTLDVPAGGSILEFGPGWGNLTMELARTGYRVTAVDIAPDFLALVGERARREARDIKLIHGDFSVAAEIDRRFDAVVFFESFHHCLDHRALVAELKRLVEPRGKVVFAAEPITDDFDVPWGIRLDGESLWAMRRNSWFESGFRESYFVQMLRSEGWRVTKTVCDETPWGVVFVATR